MNRQYITVELRDNMFSSYLFLVFQKSTIKGETVHVGSKSIITASAK